MYLHELYPTLTDLPFKFCRRPVGDFPSVSRCQDVAELIRKLKQCEWHIRRIMYVVSFALFYVCMYKYREGEKISL